MAEFLPLCDVLFNVISLAGYFCDVVFDVVLGYALFERGKTSYGLIVISLVSISLIVSQIVSIRWYMNQRRLRDQQSQVSANALAESNETDKKKAADAIVQLNSQRRRHIGRYIVIALHCGCTGVLWRYAKLFVPVDLRHVKHEVRDLCMLRLVHAFCEAAPMLLLQLHVLVGMQAPTFGPELHVKPHLPPGSVSSIASIVQQSAFVEQQQIRTFRELNIVSAILSLFSLCWALASFSKNVRLQNVHRLVLTWLGVIFQFVWRLGTVIARVTSLTVYASLYSEWVFLVIILHWISMLLWLVSPKNVFHGERISRLRKTLLAAMIAFVYVFAYINLQEVNHRQKMATFYVVMFLENTLLVGLWLAGIWPNRPDNWYLIPVIVWTSFFIGMVFMVLYYRYFHVRRLGYEAGGRLPGCEYSKQCSSIPCKCIATLAVEGYTRGNGMAIGGTGHYRNDIGRTKYHSHAIPGVFNCRFSNAVGNCTTKRKKKKPTSFVPPPTIAMTQTATSAQAVISTSQPTLSIGSACSAAGSSSNGRLSGPMSVPFWRRPLPNSQHGGSSENEGSVGSRVNIHQKLQEKKQKQLAELKIIEEEIKQGKLGGLGEDGNASLPRQPIPRTKKHIDVHPLEWRPSSPPEVLLKFAAFEPGATLYAPHTFAPLMNGLGAPQTSVSTVQGTVDHQPGTPNHRNMSPISSQVSATESNSLTRLQQQQPQVRQKIRNPFFSSPSPVTTGGGRQISGTYSANADTIDHLPFPYNVVPPPRSKLDSRPTSVAPHHRATPSGGVAALHRANTPEILLTPHSYLETSRIYYDWLATAQPLVPMSSGDERVSPPPPSTPPLQHQQTPTAHHHHHPHANRAPSDIDSQVSLPRSYTLPREFKYYRRNKCRKLIKTEHFIASTNSSDGDVDSGDDNESERFSNLSINSQQRYRSPTALSPTNFHSHPSPTTITAVTAAPVPSPVTVLKARTQGQLIAAISANVAQAGGYPNLVPSVDVKPVNSLDLISGVTELNGNSLLNRQLRIRAYAPGRGLMVRHETKL